MDTSLAREYIAKEPLPNRSCLRRLRAFYHYWYLQYIIHTGLYMLEPYERVIFTSFALACTIMCLYTAYIFLPGHLLMLWKYFVIVLRHFGFLSQEFEDFSDLPVDGLAQDL